MFILEWLTDYMNTPKMEMTAETEMLGMLAIGIIVFFGDWNVLADRLHNYTGQGNQRKEREKVAK